MIVLASGIDATILAHTYHPTGISTSILDALTIGTLMDVDAADTTSYYDWSSEFYTVLRQRVTQRLRLLKKSRRGSVGNCEIWIKACGLLCSFWISLWIMCTSRSGVTASLAAIAMGVSASFVGTCIQHDGSHGAFSTVSGLNTLAGWTLDMIGASAFTWEIQHVLGHHPYTNLMSTSNELLKQEGNKKKEHPHKDAAAAAAAYSQESDPDVFSSFPFMRMHPSHPLEWYHQYQHSK